MKINHLLANLSAFIAFYFYSGFVCAQESSESSAAGYAPIILLLAILLVFRKKLIAEATPEHHGEDTYHPVETKKPVQAAKPSAARKSNIVDLSIDAEQCQATTAKGSRCSRNTNLETIELTIDGKKYRFRTCKQHGNDSFKPFSGLI